MGVEEQSLKRPYKCFNILKECLIYTNANYPEELESVIFYNDFNKEKVKQLPVSSLKVLEDFKYQDFKSILATIGIKDIREAFISFKRQPERKKLQLFAPYIPKNRDEVIDQILEWLDRCIEWEKMLLKS